MNFESSASLIVLTFLQVTTIGLINLSSSQLSSFLMYPSDLSHFSSVSTVLSKCRGSRLPFSCIGLRGSWKWVIFV